MARTRIIAKRKNSLAHRADKFDLYEQSVQEPESQCRFYRRVFKKEYRRSPKHLREDFCGTGALCCEWVRSQNDHRARGYDLDLATLEWGRKNNIAPLDPSIQERVELVQQDVREVDGPKADVISAENFSYFIFLTREELRRYLEAARQNLAFEGVLVLDIMGGQQCYEENRKETRRLNGFKYIWEQARFDPITGHCTYHIHFHFRDGSEVHRAFTYEWRLWTIPEIRELLLEAGFSRVDVYWEGTGADGEGNGIYRVRKHAESDPSWIAYIVGIK